MEMQFPYRLDYGRDIVTLSHTLVIHPVQTLPLLFNRQSKQTNIFHFLSRVCEKYHLYFVACFNTFATAIILYFRKFRLFLSDTSHIIWSQKCWPGSFNEMRRAMVSPCLLVIYYCSCFVIYNLLLIINQLCYSSNNISNGNSRLECLSDLLLSRMCGIFTESTLHFHMACMVGNSFGFGFSQVNRLMYSVTLS